MALEAQTAAEAGQRVMRKLRAIFEPQGVAVPAPLQVRAGSCGPPATAACLLRSCWRRYTDQRLPVRR